MKLQMPLIKVRDHWRQHGEIVEHVWPLLPIMVLFTLLETLKWHSFCCNYSLKIMSLNWVIYCPILSNKHSFALLWLRKWKYTLKLPRFHVSFSLSLSLLSKGKTLKTSWIVFDIISQVTMIYSFFSMGINYNVLLLSLNIKDI